MISYQLHLICFYDEHLVVCNLYQYTLFLISNQVAMGLMLKMVYKLSNLLRNLQR